MLTTTELIVLKGVRYSDTSSIVHTYSEQFGSLSLKITRTPFSKKRGGTGAFFIPLSILSITLDHRENRQIFTPRETNIIHVPSVISIDPIANAVALFLTELLNRLLRTDGGDAKLYGYLRGKIIGLDDLSTERRASFHLGLMTGLLYHFGILPEAESYRDGYVLDCTEGRFRPPYNTNEAIMSEASGLLYRFIATQDPEALPLHRTQRNNFLELLLRYLTCHFPEVGTLHSPDILTQLFQ